MHSSAYGLRLRSTDKHDLHVRWIKTWFGDHAFSAAGPMYWNSLPFLHSFIPAISIAPLQVHYNSEALPTTAQILYRNFRLQHGYFIGASVLRVADSIDSFKTGLQTYLFSRAYSAVS